MGLLSDVSSQISNTTKKSKRKQRRLADTQSRVAIARAKRSQEAFMEDAQRQRLTLNERLAARGMSAGTHAGEEKRLFENAYSRGMQTAGEDITMAEQGADILAYQKKTRNRANPLKIIDFVTEQGLEAGLAVATGGASLLGGGMSPETGTSGLAEASW